MPETSPFYLNWEFWSAIAAAMAITLSQLPPVYLWFRPRRLEVEVHPRIGVSHKVGNPNISMFLMIRNTGGRGVRAEKMQIALARDGKSLCTLPAQSYFKDLESKSAVLFVPFSLKPDDEAWSHTTNFYNQWDRATDKTFRRDESAMREDIQRKIAARDPDNKQAVLVDPGVLTRFLALFEQNFIWHPGEYVITLSASTDSDEWTISRQYRFTLYESDTAALRAQTEDYKFGGGIAYTLEKHSAVWVPILPQGE
jgi:hypothetical protein